VVFLEPGAPIKFSSMFAARRLNGSKALRPVCSNATSVLQLELTRVLQSLYRMIKDKSNLLLVIGVNY